MKEVGGVLKAKRQELGLSLSEASLSTKISPKVLNAIENGTVESLPALPFAKGFIRSYAIYLKLDPEEILGQFLREIGDVSEVADVHAKLDNAVSNAVDVTDDGGGGIRFLLIGGVVLLIGLIVGVKSLIDKYQKEAAVSEQIEVTATPIEQSEKSEEPETPVETPPSSPEASETTPPVGVPVAAPASTAPPATPPVVVEEKKEAPPASTAPVPTPTPAATPTPVAVKPTPAPEVTKPAPVPVIPPAAPTAPTSSSTDPQEVIVEALDSVTVSATIGGERKQIKLKAGEVHVLRANSKIVLDLSDGGAVNVIYNGRNRGVPGSLGQAKKLNFP